MNQLRYQTYLLTRVLQGNDFPSSQALLDAIVAACAIPETEWGARKAAFNEIAAKAPLRSGHFSDFAITHSDIPRFLEREWREFNAFATMTRNITKPNELDKVVGRYWLPDEAYQALQNGGDEDEHAEAESAPRG